VVGIGHLPTGVTVGQADALDEMVTVFLNVHDGRMTCRGR
jgi:hypothetical protein